MTDFRKAKILILGGTGTLGRALTKEIDHSWPDAEITILSRDEHKQAAMRREFPKCRYVIGDIRKPDSLTRPMGNKDIVFHVAALKHVDTMEENIDECMDTNYTGTKNAARAAALMGVKHFIFSSTDKAIDPYNVYGASKFVAERLLYSMNKDGGPTKFSVYRWGNVLGSQGSAIPYFAQTLKAERKAYITDQAMTRYWLPIEWAVRYMLRSFPDAKPDRAMICPNMKAAPLTRVIACIAQILNIHGYVTVDTGMRLGEKIHEAMTSQHAPFYMASNTADQYTDEELIELLRPIVEAA